MGILNGNRDNARDGDAAQCDCWREIGHGARFIVGVSTCVGHVSDGLQRREGDGA